MRRAARCPARPRRLAAAAFFVAAAAACAGVVLGKAGDSFLLAGEVLASGEWISGGNGFLLMQADGDLVVCTGVPTRATHTCEGKQLWSAGTRGNPGAHVKMLGFGSLAVYSNHSTGEYDRLWFTKLPPGCSTTQPGPASTTCAYVDRSER